uniref:universal stress protein n=1 Tax=Psychromonas sp. Urea-02u-13 TaxID=2058326 RepID=UPI000CC1F449
MKKITACIDGNDMATIVGEASFWAAKKLKAPLTLLHVLDKSEYQQNSVNGLSGAIGLGAHEVLLSELTRADEIRSKLALQYGNQLLDDLLMTAKKQPLENVNKQQIHGDLVSSLLDLESTTRLFILGKSSQQEAENSHVVGSLLESVIRLIKSHLLIITQPFQAPTSYMV